ncbi:MAG: DUF1565 domain-containing protein [Pseudonocardiaceae bacterium]|nr:DUF1565 domain-containing protein [Pseudonocardiaceae bacterium]
MPLTLTEYRIPHGALFVSTNGNDSAAGTEESPLRNLATAVRRAPSGATIVLREGTYRESVGEVRKRLTIQPFPTERVWLKGSVVVRDWSRDGAAWRHDGWSPELCDSCFHPDIIDAKHPLAGRPDMVFVNGKPLRQVDDRDAVGPGTFYVDTANDALFVGDNPTGSTVESTAFDRLIQFDSEQASGSAIRGIGIAQYGSNQNYGSRGAMVVVNAPGVTLRKNTFGWSASSGVGVFQPDTMVRGNHFVDNGLVGLVANRADRLRLFGNRFTRNNRERFALSGEAIGAAGAKITRTERPYVSDNYFRDNFGTGWWCDLGCTDATVIRNVAMGNAVNGLYYEVSSRALIASNVVVGNGARGLKISSSDRVRVYHNTFADNSISVGLYNDPREPSFDPYSERLGLSWTTTGTTLVNNVYAQSENGKPIIESEDHKSSSPRKPFVARSDGNGYFHSDQRRASLLSWSTGSGEVTGFDSLAAFSRATGQDRDSVSGSLDPSPFRDSASENYALRESAPGEGAGLAVPPNIAAKLSIAPVPHPNIGVVAGPHAD